jgi:O-antigen/teichoic acid export membrane protein
VLKLKTVDAESLRGGERVLWSAGARILALPVSAILGLLAARITISHIGADLFGYVTVIATLMAMLPFADLGVGAALINATAAAKADAAARSRLDRVVLTSVRTLTVSSLVVVMAAVVVALTIGWPAILGVPQEGLRSANFAAVAVIVLFALSLPMGLGQRLLIGSQHGHVAVLASTVAAPVTFTLTWLVAVSGARPAWYATPPMAGALTAGVVSALVARRIAGVNLFAQFGRVFATRRWPGETIRHAAVPMFVIMVGLPIALQTDRVILSHRSSAGQLAMYALAAQLFVVLSGVLSTAGASLWPIFAGDRVKSAEHRRNEGLWLGMVAAFGITAIAASAVLVAVGPWVAHLVSGGKIVLSEQLLLAMSLLLVIQAIHLPSGMFLTDEAGLRFQAFCIVIMVSVNIAVSWWAAGRYGAIGPVIGSIVAVGGVQLVPSVLKVARRYREAEVMGSLRRVGRPPVGAGLPAELSPAGPPALVVVPTLGERPDWLIDTVRSVREQGSDVCDLVLVTPTSVSLNFLCLRPGERVLRCDIPGVAPALNRVWRQLAGDYEFLTWLGDDDLLAPGAVRAAVHALRASPDAVAVYGHVTYIRETGLPWYTVHPTRFAARYLRWGKNFLPQPGSLVRERAARDGGWLDESLKNSFDQQLFTRLSGVGPLVYLPRILASYRVHSASITARKGLGDESERVRLSVHGRTGRVVYRALRPFTRLLDQLIYSTQSRLYGAKRTGTSP